jgi:NADPH2:quinone reductase
VAIDYRHEDFLSRARELTGDGVDVALDPFGGAMALRSFRALRRGGRLVIYGRQNTIVHGRKNWRGVFEWYAGTALVVLWGLLSPRGRVLAYRIQKLRIPHQDWFQEDFRALLALLRDGKIHPVAAERLPLSDARKAHELLEIAAAVGKLVLVS